MEAKMKLSVTIQTLLLTIIFATNAISEDLVAYYPFNENANDHSGNENHGTVYGATLTADRFGNPESAFSFDGVNDYIEVIGPQKLDLTSWTISGWVSIKEITYTSIVGKHHNADSIYNYSITLSPEDDINPPRLSSQYEIDDDPEDFDHYVNYSLANYALNDWLFFASLRDEITGRHALFIDGALSEENWWTDVPSTSPENLFIGRIVNDLPNYFNGTIDDIRIYNRSLTPDEIDSLYHEGGWVTSTKNKIPKMLLQFRLNQNYPNPFNPSTTIEFDLLKTSEVTLKIFNLLGEEVATLVSDRLNVGSYSYEWEASQLASGVYLYRLEAGEFIEIRKMLLLR